MTTTSQSRRTYRGPVLFSLGFRPFFLFAGLFSAVAMAVWGGVLFTGMTLPGAFYGLDWHMHEMVFGYTSAVVAGFLLTAVPNWTGRLPVIGWRLAALFSLWLAGRAVILLPTGAWWGVPFAVDEAFFVALVLIFAREILAGRNWKNLPVVTILSLLALANALYWSEAASGDAMSGFGIRLGVASIVFLLTLIGGRVTPSFTRNWMVKAGLEARPASFGRFDAVALALAGITLVFWVVWPAGPMVKPLALFTAVALVGRLSRWKGWKTTSEPLVLILHLGYFFVPLGFAMIAASGYLAGWSGPQHIPHAWSAGAFGTMTLAMMTRASLGHSGRPLSATLFVRLIYALAILSALSRVTAEVVPSMRLLVISALLWIAAYCLFFIIFFPIMARPKR